MWEVRALLGPLEHDVSKLSSGKYNWVYVVKGRGKGVVSEPAGLCSAAELRFPAHGM